jgi:two-component system, sensor histidine kinase and response regulator
MRSTEIPRPPSILLVDDTVENLRLLAGMLATRGFDARPVTSGREALQAAAHEPPDLVLLDVTMPEMSGFEVCLKLRENPATRDVPIIFLTALTEVENKVKGFAVGGTDYVTKPFQLEEVLARVGNQLALRAARQQLERSLQKVREAEQMRDDLANMIVHDMRSPLTVLLMQLEMMKGGATGQMADDVRDAIQGAMRLNELASTLLDVSRLEEGKMPLSRTATDLSAMAHEVRTALSAVERERPIEVTGADAVVFACDAGLIRRVMENLVSNAIKHTPRKGKVRIDVTPRPHGVRIAVHDEGSGVPMESRHTIFEKFGAVTVRKDRTYHSVGLGLAFCKLTVEAHGGWIAVEDGSPVGSVFAFELPNPVSSAVA